MGNLLQKNLPPELTHMRRRLVSNLSYATMQAIGRTMSFRESGADAVRNWLFRKKERAIIVFWHNRLFFLSHYLANFFVRKGCKFSVMVSASRDGEYIAGTIRKFNARVVRGSSSKGGMEALEKLVGEAQRGFCPILTPDGPRGPRYMFQPGALLLAQKTGLPVIPLAYGVDRAWIFKSWDGFIFPKPFSRAEVIFGEPIRVPENLSNEERERWVEVLNRKLTEATETADRLARPDAGASSQSAIASTTGILDCGLRIAD